MKKLTRFLLMLFPFMASAQTNNAPFPKDIFNNQQQVQQWLAQQNIPALGVGVITNGKLQHAQVFSAAGKGPYAGNTIFNVASLTKPVVAYVTLQLVSQGKWQLDAPLYKYWTDPDVAADPRSRLLTTRHVLTHQTGFPNWRYSQPQGRLAFEADPGSKYQYSGEGFEYLRRALEQQFGTTLDRLAHDLILKPLGMKDTRFFWDATMQEKRFAAGHDTAGKAYEVGPKNKAANAADDLLTTIEDYSRFLIAVMNGKGLSKEVFEAMTTNQAPTTRGKHFGLGFEKYDFENGAFALSHGGSDKGVKTLAFIIPQTGQGLVIFTNSDVGYKVYEPLVQEYLGTYGKSIIEIETKE
jgi:CubicO group peptidase (beta-lactamase class C family)